jgi:hypothetical protein
MANEVTVSVAGLVSPPLAANQVLPALVDFAIPPRPAA